MLEGLEELQQRCAEAERAGDPSPLVEGYARLAAALAARGDEWSAELLMRRAWEIAEEKGLREAAQRASLFLGEMAYRRGRCLSACRFFSRAFALTWRGLAGGTQPPGPEGDGMVQQGGGAAEEGTVAQGPGPGDEETLARGGP